MPYPCNTMITPDTVEHVSKVLAEDIKIFAAAAADSGIDAGPVTARALAGASQLADLIRRLKP